MIKEKKLNQLFALIDEHMTNNHIDKMTIEKSKYQQGEFYVVEKKDRNYRYVIKREKLTDEG